MYKRSFAFLFSLVFITLFFLSCSEESTLSPDVFPEDFAEVSLEEFPFFPLSEAFVALYKYVSYGDKTPYGVKLSPYEEWKALLRLEVIRTIQKEESAFYKIEKTVLFPVDGYEGDLAEIDPANIDHSRTIVQEYDILYQDSTLWYVDYAPTFERLDQGIQTLFFTSPDTGKGYINIRIFGIPGKHQLNDVEVFEQRGQEGLIIKRYYGDRFWNTDLNWDVFVTAKEETGIILIVEDIYCCSTSYHWKHYYKVELLE